MATKTKQRKARQKLYKALSHPLRAEILTTITLRQASPAELSRALDCSIDDADYHLKRLVDLGCAALVGEHKVRGATEHFYGATELHFIATEDWDALDPAMKMSEVGQFMQAQIDAFVKSAAAGIVGKDQYFHLTRTPHVFDEQGRNEALEICERAREELAEVGAQSAERLAEHGGRSIPYSSAHALFEMPES